MAFFYITDHQLRILHAKSQHFLSSGLASAPFQSKTSFVAKQLSISEMNGGVWLQAYVPDVAFKRFELKFWDWSQIEDLLKETISGFTKTHIMMYLLSFYRVFPWFFVSQQYFMLNFHLFWLQYLMITHNTKENHNGNNHISNTDIQNQFFLLFAPGWINLNLLFYIQIAIFWGKFGYFSKWCRS